MLMAMGVCALLLGIALLLGGVVSVVSARRARGVAVAARGVVVALEKRVLSPGSSGVWCPVIEFVTAAGERVRFESGFGTMPASHKVGAAVALLYDPAAPARAEVDSALSRWIYPGCLLAMGAGACFFGVVFAGIQLLLWSSASHF